MSLLIPGKRRKIKCHFPSLTSEVCTGCQQRETPCVTQEYEDSVVVSGQISGTEIPSNMIQHAGLENRLVRVEALLERLLDSDTCLPPSTTDRRIPEISSTSFLSLHNGSAHIPRASAPAFTRDLDRGCVAQALDTALVGVPRLWYIRTFSSSNNLLG